MSFFGCIFRFFTKGFIERYIKASPGPAIKNGSLRDGDGEHFLQTHGLGTELNHVTMIELWFATLILHGKRLPFILVNATKLHHIGLAY